MKGLAISFTLIMIYGLALCDAAKCDEKKLKTCSTLSRPKRQNGTAPGPAPAGGAPTGGATVTTVAPVATTTPAAGAAAKPAATTATPGTGSDESGGAKSEKSEPAVTEESDPAGAGEPDPAPPGKPGDHGHSHEEPGRGGEKKTPGKPGAKKPSCKGKEKYAECLKKNKAMDCKSGEFKEQWNMYKHCASSGIVSAGALHISAAVTAILGVIVFI